MDDVTPPDSNCTVATSTNSDATDEDTSTGECSAKENERDSDLWGMSNRAKRLDDYSRRRQRNNLAVKKSRDKAKQRQKEFARHLEVLTVESKRLYMKAEVLMKELNLLRGLFPVVGLSPPPEVDCMLTGD